MSKNNSHICRCCLKVLSPMESRIQTTNKTREIFTNFIGSGLMPGVICGKCNINLLTFDAFQKEIKRKHEFLAMNMKIKDEPVETKKPRQQQQQQPAEEEEELIEGIIFEEANEEDEEMVTVAQLVETQLEPEKPETSQSQNSSSSAGDDDDDENDVIVIPQEPQIPIDLDSISDDPQEPKPKEPEEIIFKCDHCTAVSSKKEIIIQHIKQSHTFKCEQCGKVYPNEARMLSHVMRVHNVATGNKRKQSLKPMQTEEQLKFRLKSKPYGRPWPSVLAKRKEEYGF